MDKVFVTSFGIGTIAFIYWFFFGKKSMSWSSVEAVDGRIGIVVDGGYKPSVIKLKKGKTAILKIIRKDENSCLEEIVIPDFKIKKYLPVGEEVQIEVLPKEKGEFPFHCGMNMFHGKIVVK